MLTVLRVSFTGIIFEEFYDFPAIRKTNTKFETATVQYIYILCIE